MRHGASCSSEFVAERRRANRQAPGKHTFFFLNITVLIIQECRTASDKIARLSHAHTLALPTPAIQYRGTVPCPLQYCGTKWDPALRRSYAAVLSPGRPHAVSRLTPPRHAGLTPTRPASSPLALVRTVNQQFANQSTRPATSVAIPFATSPRGTRAMVPPQAAGGSFVVDMTDDCRRAVISQEPQADPTDVVWAGKRFTLGASAAPEEQSGEDAQLLKSGDVLLPSYYTKKRSAASPRRPRLTPSKHSRRRDERGDSSSDELEPPPLRDAFMRAARTTCYYYCGRRPSMRRAMALFGTLAVLATWRGRGGGLLT